MAAVAVKPMTVAEFLAWNPPGDTRYELIAGRPVAMAPANGAHQLLAVKLARRLDEALDSRPPCNARTEAGVRIQRRDDRYYVADLAVSCRPPAPNETDVPDPILIVEIPSPSTERHDRQVKLPDYRSIGSVQEILLIDSERHFAEVHRRLADARWITDLYSGPDAELRLESIGYAAPLAALYPPVALANTE